MCKFSVSGCFGVVLMEPYDPYVALLSLTRPLFDCTVCHPCFILISSLLLSPTGIIVILLLHGTHATITPKIKCKQQTIANRRLGRCLFLSRRGRRLPSSARTDTRVQLGKSIGLPAFGQTQASQRPNCRSRASLSIPARGVRLCSLCIPGSLTPTS